MLLSTQAAAIYQPFKGISADEDFSLLDIPGLKAWFNAQEITGLSDGQKVTSWTDDSGTGNTVSQATSTKQPIYRTSGVNGLPSVDFIGNHYMFKSSPTGLTNITGITIVAALSPDAISGVYTISGIDFSGNRAWLIRFIPPTAISLVGSTDGTNLNIALNSQTGLTPKPYLCMASWDGTTGILEIRIDGVLTSGTTGTGTIFNSTEPILVGARTADSDMFDGDIGELAIWDRALNTSEKTQVINYFENQWGLTF